MRRSTRTLLWLYPRPVRAGHGDELAALVEDLIERDGAARGAILVRLAADGLSQRVVALITAPVLVIALALSSFGGLAVCDITAASAHARVPHHLHHSLVVRHRVPSARAGRTASAPAGLR